ncbi:hypothetical protein RvY_10487 [Ramazzottius varieornatus]|uniref:Uncharacterized protein n=1 Tax=Ramazzottius varieornatus TaxID=947166 RepID=A0A1D1VKP7_RAMVA|nr:hypothetical protein RvY_10487 [Ramazzottius varieornatus]
MGIPVKGVHSGGKEKRMLKPSICVPFNEFILCPWPDSVFSRCYLAFHLVPFSPLPRRTNVDTSMIDFLTTLPHPPTSPTNLSCPPCMVSHKRQH